MVQSFNTNHRGKEKQRSLINKKDTRAFDKLMNILEEMHLHKDELTPKELEVYHIVLNDPVGISGSTTSQIAARYHISQSSISRFCQKIGYSSYSDFRMALYLSISTKKFHTDSADPMPSMDMVDYMCDLTRAIRSVLTDSLLDSLARQVIHSESIYTVGTAYSSIPAQLLAFQLILSSHPAHVIPPGAESEFLHITKNTDTFFLFSATNATHQEFLSAVKEISPEKRPYTILITSSAKHPLRHCVNKVICLPSWISLQYPIAVDYSYATTVFCNLFSSYLMNNY